ncbi:MAG: hypothetical protein RLZZ42_864 [Bacteroidota bacterium]
MSWTNIWVHVVFATKYRKAILHKDIRGQVFRHIKWNAEQKGIYILIVNGFEDHCHILLRLSREMTLAKTVMLIKGESAYWINKNLCKTKDFRWQDDYWASSVDPKKMDGLIQYIANQEAHHQKKSLEKEIEILFPKELSF